MVIEAIQYLGDENKFDVVYFLKGSGVFDARFGENNLEIATLEGTMTVSPGDYVIKGIKGEFYPCKPDIFLASYEELRKVEATPLTPEEEAEVAELIRMDEEDLYDLKPCCIKEKRNINGGCDTCGDPCL